MPEGKAKKAPRKMVQTVYDENTGSAIAKRTMKATTRLSTGRTLYKETSYKPIAARKSSGMSASKANKGGRVTSSKAKAPAVRAKSGADCFKGGKGCGPNK